MRLKKNVEYLSKRDTFLHPGKTKKLQIKITNK
jgi:hypothetical protein